MDKSRRLFAKAHSGREAKKLGTLPNLERPPPEASTRKTQCPIWFAPRGVSTPCFRRANVSRKESICAPRGPNAPLLNTAGSSASRAVASNLPQRPALPTGNPQQSCSSKSKLRFPKHTKLAAAPVSRTTTLSLHMQGYWLSSAKVGEEGCS